MLERALQSMLILQSMFAVAAFLFVAWHRLRYPFELEWIEGGILEQVTRIVAGKRVYGPPSLEFTPFLYPPFYFYVSALVSQMFGGGFFPLRLVSVLASVVSFGSIFALVYHETRSKWPAGLGACFFLATFRFAGAWMDIARVDALFVALFLIFVYLLRVRSTTLAYALAGVVMSLAILTKQTAIIICVPVVVVSFFFDMRHTALLVLCATLVGGGVTMGLHHASDGWSTYYVWALLRQQTEWIPGAPLKFWMHDIGSPMLAAGG